MKTTSQDAPGSTPAAVSTRAASLPALEPALTAPSRIARRLGRSGRILLPLAGTLVMLGAQLAEDLGDSPPIQMLAPGGPIQRWLLVGLVAYLLGVWAVAEGVVERSLRAMRPAVDIDDAAFGAYAARMETLPARSEVLLALVSAAVSVALFAVMRADLLVDDPVTHTSTSLPFAPIGVLILAGYTVLGWAFLRLVYGTARVARALGALARERLRIDVFDTSDLLPFGNIALALAFPPAGAIAILVVTLGQPTTPIGWSVLVEATLATVLALLLPLNGVHRQMASAKHRAFAELSERVTSAYEGVVAPSAQGKADWAELAAVTGTILPLRKAVQDMTTWPFRDTLALSRALLIAAAPLIYTTLSELIRIIWIAPLTKP